MLSVTIFKNPKATFLTLTMLTGSCLWTCKIILKAAYDNKIGRIFPIANEGADTGEHRPIKEKGILSRVLVTVFRLAKNFKNR
jgi:hypothetical protein